MHANVKTTPAEGLPILSESWLKATFAAKQRGAPGPARGYYIGDTEPRKVPGLRAWHAQDNTVTFQIRVKMKPLDRTDRIGTYHPELFNLAAARKKASWKRAEWEQHGLAPPPAIKTVAEVFEEWKTLRIQNDPIVAGRCQGLPSEWEVETKRFEEMMGKQMHQPINSLRREHITDSKAAWMQKEGKSDDRCLRHMFSVVLPVLKYAVEREYMKGLEIKALMPRGHDPRLRFLLPGEIQLAYKGFDAVPHNAGIFPHFLMLTGIRLSVAGKMRWQDLDSRERTFTYNGKPERMAILRVAGKGDNIVDPKAPVMKGQEGALILIVGDALKMLDALRAQTSPASILEDPCVFPKKVRNKWLSKGNGPRYQEAMDKVSGLAGWHRHDLRRTLATYLKYVNLPQAAVSLALSHTPGKGREAQAAEATAVYTRDDMQSIDMVGTDEDLDSVDSGNMDAVASALMRAHELFRQMRDGTPSKFLRHIEHLMATGGNTAKMMRDERHPVDPRLIDVVEAAA